MSGTKNDQGKPELDLVAYDHILDIARVLSFGKAKYGKNNWREGIEAGRLYAALQRHLMAFWEGEDLDPESGLPHLSHAATTLMMLQETLKDKPELDNRYKPAPKKQDKYVRLDWFLSPEYQDSIPPK